MSLGESGPVQTSLGQSGSVWVAESRRVLPSLEALWRVQAALGEHQLFWACRVESWPVWMNRDESGLVVSSLGESGRLDESGRGWASLGESGRVWARLGESG